MSPKIAVVVPCYNEEEVLPETARRLLALLGSLVASEMISPDSTLTFVDDGSRDDTWRLIEELAARDQRVHGVKLSRNRGHQHALIAGIFSVEGDAVVSVDADLQDDISVIKQMVIDFKGGNEIVYGVRESREVDTAFKRRTALGYYGLLRRLGVDIVVNHADFRLMGRRAVDALQGFNEVNLFLRGMIPLLGFRSSTVYYARGARFAGTSKYPLRKMLGLAFDGITSFSVVPLRLITWLGFVISTLSFVMILWILYGTFVMDSVVPGWASSVVPIYFLGGIQLLSIGVLGEYVAKTYLETKRRPRYLIEKVI